MSRLASHFQEQMGLVRLGFWQTALYPLFSWK